MLIENTNTNNFHPITFHNVQTSVSLNVHVLLNTID